MKKKILIMFLLILIMFGNIVYADDMIEETTEEIINVSSELTEEPEIHSRHVLVMERSTGTILYEKDAYSKTAMASTTKILTAIVVLEKCNLQDEVTISKKAANTGGSVLGMNSNIKMTIESLLYGLLLRSGNDCAVALAEHVGGNLEGFAKMMNDKALDIGLTKSNFVTPHGLDNENHYTTAYDMAILTEYALKNEVFSKIVNTRSIDIMVGNYPRHINNTHELLGNTEGIYGVKTGFTGNAGRCLITAVKRDDLDVIIVVLGADTKKIRTSDTQKLINYIFNIYKMIDTYEIVNNAFDEKYFSENIKLLKAVEKINLKLEKKDTYEYPVNKNDVNKIKTSLYHLSLIEAPIKDDTKIGELRVMVNDKILYSLDIKSSDNIKKKNYKFYMKQLLYDIKKCF